MLKFLITRNFVYGILLLTLQQMLVAFSTYILVQLGKTEGLSISIVQIQLLALFCILLVVVYIPDTLARTFLEKSKYDSFEKYMVAFKNEYYGKSIFYTNKDIKNNVESWVTAEARNLISETLLFVYDFTALILNIILNVIVLSFALNNEFLFAYLISFGCLFVVIAIANKSIISVADVFQHKSQKLSNILLYAWDNIIIGNNISYRKWNQTFTQDLENNKASAAKHQLLLKTFSSLSIVIGLVPLAVTGYNLISTNAAFLWPIIVTLHRQVTIVQHMEILAMYLLHRTSLNKRAAMACEVLQHKYDANAVNSLINFDRLDISFDGAKQDFTNKQHLFAFIEKNNTGRVTIAGPNGIGKTCLMLDLKQHFGDNAIYVPANNVLFFNNFDNTTQSSTGTSKIQQLNELLMTKKILILDEWNANLDKKNIHEFEEKFKEFCADNILIETKHRD